MPADRTLLTEDGAARSAVLIAALGLALFALFAMVLTYAGVLRIGYSIFLGPITGLIGLNLLLAARPSTWRGYAWMAWAYEGIHAIVFTWILHELGGVSFSLFLPIFGFLVVHTEMLHPNASPFVTANLCTLAYGLLGWGEYQGWVRPTPGLVASVPASTAVVYVVFAALSLNFLALYARRHGVQLRTLANGLEEMVEVRTAELRESNANLRATAAALEHKRDEIEGLAYSITHDLKNPINAMLLLADLILRRDGGSLSEDARADLERIVETGERSERMVLDLLGMFRVTTAVEEPTLVSLDDLVSRTMDSFALQIAAKGIRAETAPLPAVWGQQAKLTCLVENLIANAIKYVPSGGGRIRVAGEMVAGSIRFRVEDNGIGIPEEYHRRIFELFGRVPPDLQRVDGRSVTGSGVGLAVIRRIVELHGGSISVASTIGRGSTFEVRLPDAATAQGRDV